MVTIDDMNKFPEKETMRKVLYNQLYLWTHNKTVGGIHTKITSKNLIHMKIQLTIVINFMISKYINEACNAFKE